jgi:hypothetical protein
MNYPNIRFLVENVGAELSSGGRCPRPLLLLRFRYVILF